MRSSEVCPGVFAAQVLAGVLLLRGVAQCG